MPGFELPRPMLFASLFTEDADAGQVDALKDAIQRLCLNDSSVRVQQCSSTALGAGFRCGFLGALHFEVILLKILINKEVILLLFFYIFFFKGVL